MADRKKPHQDEDDEAILEELQGRYDYALTAWQPILNEAAMDMRYICGDTWDDTDRAARKGRLILSFDQLGQYLNQVVNAVRQNKRAIKVTPEGAGANDKTSQLRADQIRQIEYLSHAQEAYIAAFSGAAERSYGYCRIVAEYEPKSFNRVLRIRAIPNPDQVLPDPDAQSVAGADWKYLFYTYSLSHQEFTRAYPDAKITDFSGFAKSGIARIGNWVNSDRVQVAEYWRVTTTPKKLLQIGLAAQPEQTVEVYADDLEQLGPLPEGMSVLQERIDEVPSVCRYLTNGVELLSQAGKPKKEEWAGKYIPFAACYGKILYTTEAGVSKKIIQSYIRLARDAAKYYNWIKSTEGEVMSMPVRSTYMAYEGQLAPEQLTALTNSVQTPVPVVLVSPHSERTGNAVLPFPRRELYEPPVQAYEFAAESARRDIQNALGRYSSSVGKSDTNVRSGVLQEQLDKQSDQGSYHLIDNFDAMVCHIGDQFDDLIPKYYDTARDISTRKPDDTVEMVRINDPNAKDPSGQPVEARTDIGRHAITISTGPSFDSERAEASAFADTLAGIPTVFPLIASEVVKLKNLGPIGDKIADILEFLKPPELRAMKEGGKPSPEQAQQAIGQLEAQLKEATALLQQAKQELDGKKGENDTKLAIADKDNAAKVEIAKIQFASATEVASIRADMTTQVESMASRLAELQAAIDERQADLDRVHEWQMQQEGAAQAAEQAAHVQSLEAGE